MKLYVVEMREKLVFLVGNVENQSNANECFLRHRRIPLLHLNEFLFCFNIFKKISNCVTSNELSELFPKFLNVSF